MIRRLLPYLARVAWLLPGFLLWAAYPPMAECADSLFALAPLLWLARNRGTRENLRTGFLNGLVFWGATLSWMPAIVKNGGPWPLVVLGWAGLAAYCALYFGAFSYLAARYWRWARNLAENESVPPGRAYAVRLAGLLLVEPVLWCGLELVRARLFTGFAWHALGVPLVNFGLGAPAALGGVYLVSAAVVLANGTLASLAERMLPRLGAGARAAAALVPPVVRTLETALPVLALVALYWGGASAVKARTSDAELGVALVQRNFPCCFSSAEREDPIGAYSALLEGVRYLGPALTVLSESALAEFGPIGSSNAEAFRRWFAARSPGALLAGGGRRDGQRRIYNSAVLWPADAGAAQVYDKVHLVPFGEFIPGDKLIPALQKLAPVGSCTPGEPKLLTLDLGPRGSVPFAVAICFEDLDSAQLRDLAARGARFLAFVTNDSWFSHSEEAVQHSWQAVARAIETGLPVVRTGNSGATGVILPDGTASWLCGPNGRPLVDDRGTLFVRVPYASGASAGPLTPYVRLGDVPLAVAFALLILGLIVVKYKEL